MSVNPVEYWNAMQMEKGHSCPNVSLFRFLGQSGVTLEGKSVLEVGFGANRGADLLQCKDRGAFVFGVDINDSYISDFSARYPEIQVSKMNAGVDPFPFPLKFDLIFHRDVVYYLTDEEIFFHFYNAFEQLRGGGYLCFQFIERDITLKGESEKSSNRLDLDELNRGNSDEIYLGDQNPIRKLDIDWLIEKAVEVGFRLKATKTVIESYSPDESVYRVDRYILLIR